MRVLRVAWLLVAAALLLVLGPPAAARTEPLSDVGQSTFARIAGCAADAEHLLVAIVVDGSSSLRDTDPQNRRVDGIETAVDSLAGLQQASAGRLSVEASLAAFSSDYDDLVPWGAVEGGHADDLLRAAREELPGRNRDEQTDYRVALRGAEQSLRSRQADLQGSSCPVVLWFTDGELDVAGSEQAAAAQLCDPQGLVDVLRGARIPVVAVALFTDSGPGAVPPAAREELRAIAEGAGDGTSCGTQPLAPDAAPGAYLRADQPAALRRLFAGVGALIEGGRQAEGAGCPGPACPDGRLTVPVDPGLAGFRAVVETSSPPRLVGPGGGRHELRPGSTTVDGAAVSVTSGGGLTVVSVTYPAGPPTSVEWGLETGTDEQAAVDLYYVWGVSLTVAAPDGLVVGEPSRVQATARFGDGTPVDPDVYRSLDLTLRAGGTQVPVGALTAGVAAGEVAVPGGSPAAVELSASAAAVSAPSGIRLGPVAATTSVTASLPPAFPRLDTSRLEFPALEGTTTATAALELTGSDRGPTRACYAPGTLTGPPEAGNPAVGSADRCVDLPAGEQRRWDFRLTTGAPADGRVDGRLDLTLTAVDGQSTTVAVPVTAALVRPVDEPLRWGLTAALVLLALALPCAIGWVGNAAVARYGVGPRTRVASVPVVLTPDGPRRTDGAAALLTPEDFGYLDAQAPRRVTRLDAAGLRFSRTLPLVPFAEPAAWVRSASGELVASTERHEPWVDGQRARAGFGLGSRLYLALAHPGPDGDVRGRLVSVAEETHGLRDLVDAQLAEAARSGAVWEDVHERVEALRPEPDAAAAPVTEAEPQYRPVWQGHGPDVPTVPPPGAGIRWDDGGTRRDDGVGPRWEDGAPAPPGGRRRPRDDDAGTGPDDGPPSVFRGG
ncbi:vWA domain-containing protein [Georgenia sp. AZ-5]|uniref:vWA domain-containing protein n=1 Tax=Georgenia sp. AZ-5 TaxID=3367526 RepID=UPI003754D79E